MDRCIECDEKLEEHEGNICDNCLGMDLYEDIVTETTEEISD